MTLPSRDELPADAADWNIVRVDLPRLSQDSEESCPVPLDQIFNYVRRESGDAASASHDRMAFVRTATIAGANYWVWRYIENDGMECFVLVRSNDSGHIKLSLSGSNGLSVEQYMLADHFDEIYWP